MKRTILVASFVALTACTASNSSAPTPAPETVVTTPAPTTPPTTETPYLDDNDFVLAIWAAYPEARSIPASMIVDTALAVCNALETGLSGDDVIATIMASSANYTQMEFFAYLSGAATGWFCPEYGYIWD